MLADGSVLNMCFCAGVQRSVRHGGERAVGSDDEDSDFE